MKGPPGTEGLLGHIFKQDVYRVRGLPPDRYDYIFDIGANVGFFCIQARVLFPRAHIIAIEPDPEAFPFLRDNVDMLRVELENVGVGDGKPAFFGKRAHPLSALVTPEDWNESPVTTINTVPFPEIFRKYGCTTNKPYMIKCNCEGGEKYFVQDPECNEIFKNARDIGMMIHFQSRRTPYSHWLTWRDYDDWFRGLLKDSHNIDYTLSRGRMGKGHFFARKIEC